MQAQFSSNADAPKRGPRQRSLEASWPRTRGRSGSCPCCLTPSRFPRDLAGIAAFGARIESRARLAASVRSFRAGGSVFSDGFGLRGGRCALMRATHQPGQ